MPGCFRLFWKLNREFHCPLYLFIHLSWPVSLFPPLTTAHTFLVFSTSRNSNSAISFCLWLRLHIHRSPPLQLCINVCMYINVCIIFVCQSLTFNLSGFSSLLYLSLPLPSFPPVHVFFLLFINLFLLADIPSFPYFHLSPSYITPVPLCLPSMIFDSLPYCHPSFQPSIYHFLILVILISICIWNLRISHGIKWPALTFNYLTYHSYLGLFLQNRQYKTLFTYIHPWRIYVLRQPCIFMAYESFSNAVRI